MILKLCISLVIISLFIYSKLNAYESQISTRYLKAFSIIKKILNPILNGLGTIFNPFEVGNKLFLDTRQIILLILLLLILIR